MEKVIVIPTYNEKGNIAELLDKIRNLPEDFDLLFVDDNSPDGTGKLLDRLAEENDYIRVLHREKKEGLGPAYVAGFKEALKGGYDLIFQMDADLSHDPKYLPALSDAAEEADLAVGSRYLQNRISVVNWPLKRLIKSRLASTYVTAITGLPQADATSGFKAFKREVLEDIDLDKIESNGYSFQIEMSYQVHKKGYRIKEVPIIFIDRMNGASKMNRGIFWEAAWIVWKIRLGL